MKRRDRYYIVETWGWGIHPGSKASTAAPGCSFSILDRFWDHREVARFVSGAGGATPVRELASALAECERLNADERQWERAA